MKRTNIFFFRTLLTVVLFLLAIALLLYVKKCYNLSRYKATAAFMISLCEKSDFSIEMINNERDAWGRPFHVKTSNDGKLRISSAGVDVNNAYDDIICYLCTQPLSFTISYCYGDVIFSDGRFYD